ncbi:MAG: crossover junction endodeoxyribonuclease RuvC [Candidatus Brocadiia bacterium]
MRILGIDPGLQVTGYGLVAATGARARVVEAGVVRTDEAEPLAERIRTLHEAVARIVGQLAPEVIAVEELYSHYRHPATAILMGHARGVVFLAAAQAGVPVVSYAATRIKKSLTGQGRASKEQVQRMVRSRLGLRQMPRPPDVADALAVALCHGNVVARQSRAPGRRDGVPGVSPSP